MKFAFRAALPHGLGSLPAEFPACGQVVVGGSATPAFKDTTDDAVNSKDHSTPAVAAQGRGLIDKLRGPASFGVFAQASVAFASAVATSGGVIRFSDQAPLQN